MIKCIECQFHQRPLPQALPSGEVVAPPTGSLGHCRFFPPVPIIEHSAAIFGPVQMGSPLTLQGVVEVPGWKVVPSVYATYPVVKDDWGCAQGQKKLEVAG